MILATHKNEVTNLQTELHQIATNTFEVKRYYMKLNGVDLVLKNLYTYDLLETAQDMFDIIKS